MAVLGDAYIEVHADTGPFDRELAASVERALIKAETAMRQRGRDAGNAFGEGVRFGIEDQLKNVGDDFSDKLVKTAQQAGTRVRREVGNAIGGGDGIELGVRVKDEDLDRESNRLANWAARAGGTIASSLLGAFAGIGSVLPNLLNIGSNSTLGKVLSQPAILLAVLGAAGGLLIGLSQVLVPLAALILSLPAGLSVLGAVALGLTAVFTGLTDAIAGAFSAKTPEEFAKALEGLEGNTKDFVSSFGILGNLWRGLVGIAQREFFNKLDHSFRDFVAQNAISLQYGIRDVAGALGELADKLMVLLSSPAFSKFLDEVFASTTAIIELLTPGVIAGLSGFFTLIEGSLPFLESLAEKLSLAAIEFKKWVEGAKEDGSLKAFFDNAESTLTRIFAVGAAAFAMVKSLLTTLEETGFKDAIFIALESAFTSLKEFFESEDGKSAIQNMIVLAVGFILIATEVVIWIMRIIGWLDELGKAVWWVIGFFPWLWGVIKDAWNAIVEFFTNLDEYVEQHGKKIKDSFKEAFNSMVAALKDAWNDAVAFFKGLPTRITNAAGDLGNVLYDAGKNVINGFINGIKDAAGGLWSTLSWITDNIPNFKGPESVDRQLLVPAGRALMDGLRMGIREGAEGVLGDLGTLTGMIGFNATANTFMFGRGSIQQNFAGQPTPEVANQMGSNTGRAIANTVNNQTLSAAVRAV